MTIAMPFTPKSVARGVVAFLLFQDGGSSQYTPFAAERVVPSNLVA
jgi:hypothetical protein